MKRLIFPAILLLASSAFAAEDFDYAKVLRDQGFKYCAAKANAMTNWLLDQDGRVLGSWSKSDTDNHMATLLGSKRYKESNTLMYMTAVRTPNGGCDVSFSVSYVVDKACTSLRETTFKDWKFFDELQGVPIYDDPTMNNVQITMQPFAGFCLVNKTGVLFYREEDMK